MPCVQCGRPSGGNDICESCTQKWLEETWRKEAEEREWERQMEAAEAPEGGEDE